MDNPNYTTEHRKGQHLLNEERYEIEVRLKDGWSIYKIAKHLGRAYNTIKDEVERGTVTLYNGISIFKEVTGSSPLAFKQNIRIERAKSLLITTDLSTKEIAEMVGYTDPQYFYRVFRKKNDISPGEFRKRYKHSMKE